MRARFWQKAIVWILGVGVVTVLGAFLILHPEFLKKVGLPEGWYKDRKTDISGDYLLQYTPPPIYGIIEAVKLKEKLVVLSVGKNQKVQEGFKFTVYRGDHFIGKVQVTKVYDDLAGAKILFMQENEEIRIGDKAATQI